MRICKALLASALACAIACANAAQPPKMKMTTPIPEGIQTPNVLGIIDDAWFHYVADFGNAGPDRGQESRLIPTSG